MTQPLFKENTPDFQELTEKQKKIVKTPPIFKGKLKSRKNRENTPVFKASVNPFLKLDGLW
jgi:hypothetical protein